MKILILGGNGNIGGFLSKSLSEEHEIISISRQDIDITSKEAVFDLIDNTKPDAVIDSAGISDIDFCELNEELSYTTNTIGTMNVALSCALNDIPLMYISSAQVYGMDSTYPHAETDICEPINVFGKSKLAGENLIRTLCKKYFIIRTSWCFSGEKCFVKKILEKKDTPIFMVVDMGLNPTYLPDLSNAISSIIKTNYYGIYNCTNSGSEYKTNIVKFILSYLGCNKNVISLPDNILATLAPRPKHCILNTSLLTESFNIEMPSWQNRMEEYLSTITK